MRAFQISLFYISIENFITINWLIRLLKRTGRFFMLVRAWPLYLWELLKAKRDWPCLSLGRYILNVKVRMISVSRKTPSSTSGYAIFGAVVKTLSSTKSHFLPCTPIAVQPFCELHVSWSWAIAAYLWTNLRW